jgi:hypothetical protein
MNRNQAIDRLNLYFAPIAFHLEKIVSMMEQAQVGIDDLDLISPDERDDIAIDWDAFCHHYNRAVRIFDAINTAVKDEIALRNLSK